MTEQFVPIPDDALPEFDELYSVSDLHLGGTIGFQIFNAGRHLKDLIDHLRGKLPPERRVALVINGDFVDFLAEAPSRHFDPDEAIRKLNRIVTDESFAMVWTALQEFTKTENRFLLVNLGNHDLELALPWVRHRLLEILSGNDPAARGRITLAFDGAGVRCRVGKARVLCVHGNEVDDWNLADYEALRRLGRDIVQGKVVADWQPNAGAKMVIEVMNDLKKQFPFVDLLKPETNGVVPILGALARDKQKKLDEIASVVGRLTWDSIRRRTGFLSGEEEERTAAATAPRRARSVAPRAKRRQDAEDLATQLFRETEWRLEHDIEPLDLVQREEAGEMLGVMSAFFNWARGADTSEVLRAALDKLVQDRSFEFDQKDDTFTRLDEQISGNIDFLIAGHTHLERALPRTRGGGFYFNSGTWARLIKLQRDVLEDAQKFREVFEVFQKPEMKALDDFPNLVQHYLTVVSIRAEKGNTHGELWHVKWESADFDFTPVSGTNFTKR